MNLPDEKREELRAAILDWPNAAWLRLPGPVDLTPDLARHLAPLLAKWLAEDAHDSCRRATARAWGAFLELALLDRLDDGTPVLALVFEHHPTLKRRLAEALSTRPIPPAKTEEER